MQYYKVLYVDPDDPVGNWTVYSQHRTLPEAYLDYELLRLTYRFVQITHDV